MHKVGKTKGIEKLNKLGHNSYLDIIIVRSIKISLQKWKNVNNSCHQLKNTYNI